MTRLLRAARVMARYDALFPPEFEDDVPAFVKLGRSLAAIRLPWEPKPDASDDDAERLSTALQVLGPSYIKLGQFLATRADIIGPDLAGDLALLRDKLPPFDQSVAIETIETDLGQKVSDLFVDLGDPVAAASIAQVHKATIADAEHSQGGGPDGLAYRPVAVKVLRPDVEKRFAADLESFFWVARLIERVQPSARRLRPVEVVQTLADSVALEMDLRLEAAAMSEMAQNTAGDKHFRVPTIDWERTSRRVMTMEWIDGIPASDADAVAAAGHNMAELGTRVIQTFLTHALRDGFFHADMHQGNLFVDKDGSLVAVDFGIMGRLDPRSRRFLAEILFGFVRRDYRRVAEIHFEAGYVPEDKNVDTFAQALRSIGEPIFGKDAKDVSMGRLLAQLFLVTDQFDMATRPELILLQKTMVVVEGVARHFDPEHNIWDSAEPILAAWMAERLGPEGMIQDATDSAAALGRVVTHLPEFIDRAEKTARLVSDNIDGEGIKLHPSTADAIGKAQSSQSRWQQGALWIGAVALAVLAITQEITVKVLVLGAGGMGAKAAETVAPFDAVTQLTLADLDEEAARQVAQQCGSKASPLKLDVTDEAALHGALGSADAVLNCVGPFFRFGVPILTAAIETGTPYFDICDDPEPTLEMLALDDKAKAQNMLAIVGIGASPGISNLLAAKTCNALDDIDHLITGWSLDDDVDGAMDDLDLSDEGGTAAFVHWMEQCSGKVKSWVDGKLTSVSPLQPLPVTYPGLGKRTLWTVGHPEPVTLPLTFSHVTNASNAMVLNRLDAMGLQDLTRRIDAGRITIDEAAAEIAGSFAGGAGSSLQQFIGWIFSKLSGPKFPSLFALAEGRRDGQAAVAAAAITALPTDGMAGATSVPLAVALKLFIDGTITGTGVKAPEAAIDPDLFFETFHPYCEVPGPVLRGKLVSFTVT
eukprot:s1_g758.t1